MADRMSRPCSSVPKGNSATPNSFQEGGVRPFIKSRQIGATQWGENQGAKAARMKHASVANVAMMAIGDRLKLWTKSLSKNTRRREGSLARTRVSGASLVALPVLGLVSLMVRLP